MFGNSSVEEVLRDQIEMLKEENGRLQKRVDNLQDAIVSKLAPLAYADMKAMEDTPEEGESSAEKIQKWQEEMSVYQEYAVNCEEPFFKDAEDMKDKLSAMAGFPNPAGVSTHGNSES